MSVMRASEAARQLGVTYGTLANWRSLGIGPRWTKGQRLIYYDAEDIKAWKAAGKCPHCGQRLPMRERRTA